MFNNINYRYLNMLFGNKLGLFSKITYSVLI